jgi:hypothetical protein
MFPEAIWKLSPVGKIAFVILLFTLLNHLALWLQTALSFYAPVNADDSAEAPKTLKMGTSFRHAAAPSKDLIWLFSLTNPEARRASKNEHNNLTEPRPKLSDDEKDNFNTLAIIQFILYTIIAMPLIALMASYFVPSVKERLFTVTGGETMSGGYMF